MDPVHPKAFDPRDLSRRAFLRKAGMAGVAMPTLAAILAACSSGAQQEPGGGASSSGASGSNTFGTGGVGGAPYPLARLDAPVTWNILDDNQPIESGLEPEQGATLKYLNWPYYLSPALVRAFEEKYAKYDVTVEKTIYPDMAGGVSTLRASPDEFDVMFGVQIYVLGQLIAGGLLAPLNHDYIPNLANNVWPALQSPFYDQESRYTVPFAIWNTGIMWRNDKVSTDIEGMANPYDVFWEDAPKDKTALLNNSRDSLGMAMFRAGVTDVNTGDQATIDKAKSDIAEVVAATNARFDHTDYTDVPDGKTWLHQSWSGNVGSAFYFLPEGDTAPNISYYWPGATDGIPGNVDNDTIVLIKGSKAPVLAHLFIDFMLDAQNALTNYTTYSGYQAPMTSINPDELVGNKVVPEHLATTIVTEDQFAAGYRELELAPDVSSMWESAYQEIQAGV
jgi:spermidine/putrescine transport system substrate-binding protein